ncbi:MULTISPECIES: flagellar hook-basal body complex protein FliE [Pseudobutyrivibrio]|jgi:flagellar hook-basal body complex protein FliE|uniref:Flagellar hook-basal body complex protein FliE n=2 Tax=Pseudobutyrivibrio ruminis TaxID=46206 RepID=A0A1H7IAA5_9FIRM|nr:MULTISPECIES: flagellar hook-basal body complex protein FliE [Pseudobutyrivibrio]MBE5914180.1 flagellar hook-basal body complex protein FliE [Pseudobutyrivibrio ruminis]SEK59481.1 flagellar hook-basal body complex protein FliE [Pseudobutyrivibrio ruminis]SES74376.1 flagellar hook-basal body complex protein FliE [Pseudobutyrivibrio sp. C4]SFO30594.1 flagellar hook-basal body complex protein FliE [Pseudobutyrivibrio sp. JW11]SOC12891.1 flagellar hook-basal body complex protein FliE [Pseudobut
MDVSSIQSLYGATPVTSSETKVNADTGFQSMLNSVMSLLEDTNSQIQQAHKEEVAFQLGETDNTHDLMIAEQKANIALQYTVAVRDRVLEAYQQIMQMQV